MQVKTVGFIGIGIMGAPMAENLIKAGFSVSVYSRTKAKTQAFLDKTGAEWCDSAGACAAGKDAVITMVGYPSDVEALYFGEGGILASAAPGTYLIDMTTTDPRLSVRISHAGGQRGLHVLDAPVSGGDVGARNAALSIMVGGEPADSAACLPLLQTMGKTILHEGPAGAGQHTKMANQIAVSGALAGVCEALAYAECAGLDPGRLFQSIRPGAAASWQMENLMPKIIAGDFAPGFFLKHLIKDMQIACAQGGKESLPLTERICSECRCLEEQGLGDLGTQALIQYYRMAEERPLQKESNA